MSMSNWSDSNNNSDMTECNSAGYMNNPRDIQLSKGVNNSLGVYLTTEAESEGHLYPKGDDIYANDSTSMNSPRQESSFGNYSTTEGADEIEVPPLMDNDLYINDSSEGNMPEVDTYSSAVCATNIPAEETQTNGIHSNDTPNSNPQQLQDNSDVGVYLTNIPADKTQSNGISENGHIYTNDLTNSSHSERSIDGPGIYMDMDQESNEVREKRGKAIHDDQKIHVGNQNMDKGNLINTKPSPADTDTQGILPQGNIDEPGVYMDMNSKDSSKVGEKQDKPINGSMEDKKTNVGNPYMEMGNLTNAKPTPSLTDNLGIYLTNLDDDPEETKSHEMHVEGPAEAHTGTNESGAEAKNGYVLDPKREVYIDIIDPEEYEAMVQEKKSQINAVAESAPNNESAGACCENGYLLPVEARARRNNRTNGGEIRYVPDPTTHSGSPQPPSPEVYHTIDPETMDTNDTPAEELTQPKVVFQTTHLLTQSDRAATENSPDGEQELYDHLEEVDIELTATPVVGESKGKSGITHWHIVCLLIVLCAVTVGIAVAVWVAFEGQAPKPTQALLLNGTQRGTAVMPISIQGPADHTCDPTAFTGVGKFDHTETILSGNMALFVCPAGFVAVDNYPERYVYPTCKNGVWEPFPQCAQITTTTRRPTTVVQNCQLLSTESVKFERIPSNRPVPVGSSATRKIWFKCGEGYELVGSNSYTYCNNGVLIPAPNCTETDYSDYYDYK